jgi:glutathione S-transferase
MGRAEVIRLIFAEADVPYEDIRIDREEWQKMKASTPFGQLPILEVDGKVLAQTQAIATYLAQKFGLNGADDWEAAKIQELYCGVNDFSTWIYPWFMEKDNDKKEQLRSKMTEEHVVPFLDNYQKFFEQNGTGFFVGSKITQIDLLMLCAFGLIRSLLAPEKFKQYPKFEEFYNRLYQMPNIKKWIENRPNTPI